MTDETLIADLIRGGVDPDLVQRVALAIIEAKATAQVAVVTDESAERRRAADRARKAAHRDIVRRLPQTSAESADIAEPPLPLSPSLPLPPQTPPSPAHPLAPTPAHTAPVREEPEIFNLCTPPSDPKPKRKSYEPADDEAWLKSLAENPIYQGFNLRLELGKMQIWCETNGCQPSRRRFVNWLNKAERGIVVTPQPLNDHQRSISRWFGRRQDAPWGADELALWQQLPPIHADDWQALEWFYTKAPGDKRLCQSVRSLLTKWLSEIDRAKNFNPDQK